MRATWRFKTFNVVNEYAWLKRAGGDDTLTGTEHEALEFSRKAADHLREKGICSVVCFSQGEIEGVLDLPGFHVMQIVPHPNGTDWMALPSSLHHGGWWQKLEHAVRYAVFRGRSMNSAVQVEDKAGKLLQVVIADQTWSPRAGAPPLRYMVWDH